MKKWRFGIRFKVMFFVVALCIISVALVWLLNVQMLEPMYQRSLFNQLESTAQVYANFIESYDAEEGVVVDNTLNPDFLEAINMLDNETLLEGKCIDISGSNGLNLIHAHYLDGECILHPSLYSWFGDKTDINWNSTTVRSVRAQTLVEGDFTFTVESDGRTQLVTTKNINDEYVLILLTDLTRVEQAAEVISTQMPFIAVLVLLFGLLGAYWLSRWLSHPITDLSNAAREVAKGNYHVRVEKHSQDEFGALAEDFNKMADEVGRTNELQRDLMANISHDLRTPLTLIKGYAETLRDITGTDAQKRSEQLNVIVDETNRLSGLVNSVMELSKYSSGTEKLDPVKFDIAQLCEEVAYRYHVACEKEGKSLQLETNDMCMVTADPNMMTRALHNLIANALHHVGEDGVVVLRALPQEDGTVRIEIEDHGEGISEQDLPYIFDKYYRSRADAGKVGTGLGLSITKAILINHGFSFGVSSALGEGSNFWFIAK